jgi:hypothetical protein
VEEDAAMEQQMSVPKGLFSDFSRVSSVLPDGNIFPLPGDLGTNKTVKGLGLQTNVIKSSSLVCPPRSEVVHHSVRTLWVVS